MTETYGYVTAPSHSFRNVAPMSSITQNVFVTNVSCVKLFDTKTYLLLNFAYGCNLSFRRFSIKS